MYLERGIKTMKKLIVIVLALVMVLAMTACGSTENNETESNVDTTPDTTEDGAKAMTYAEYDAAALDDAVVVEAYVQAKQSWWADKATVYLQDKDGGYFAYNMTCSEEDYAKLTPGTKIRITGFKTAWSGEVEIAEGATFEFVEGADTYVAEALDVTALLGTEELITKQNQFVSFKGLTVAAYDETGAAFAYKNAEEKTDDLYFKATLGDAEYAFCVEFYLTGSDTEVYKAVEALEVGQVIDIEGFLYWYEGSNPHVTSVTVVG